MSVMLLNELDITKNLVELKFSRNIERCGYIGNFLSEHSF